MISTTVDRDLSVHTCGVIVKMKNSTIVRVPVCQVPALSATVDWWISVLSASRYPCGLVGLSPFSFQVPCGLGGLGPFSFQALCGPVGLSPFSPQVWTGGTFQPPRFLEDLSPRKGLGLASHLTESLVLVL